MLNDLASVKYFEACRGAEGILLGQNTLFGILNRKPETNEQIKVQRRKRRRQINEKRQKYYFYLMRKLRFLT